MNFKVSIDLCKQFVNTLNKQNAIWTSLSNAIYEIKKHLGKLPAGLEEQAASSDETTGLLPDTVKVYLLSKLLYPPPNPSVRLLGSQGLKRLSVQTPNVRLRQKQSNSEVVCVVLTWAPLTTFQIALPTTAHTRYKVQFRPHSRAKTSPISSFSHLCRIAFESVILNEFLDFGSNSRQNSCFFCHVMNTFCVWFIQGIYPVLDFKNLILPVFSRQNWCYDEFVLEFILFPTYQILSLLRTIVLDPTYRSQ